MERARQCRWDAANLRTVGTKMTRRDYAAFRARCEEAGVTPYALLRRLIESWMAR